MAPKKSAISSGSQRFPVDSYRHKKARQAFTLRAFRTSFQALVTINKEFWWSWRELNPRPKFLHPRYYMLSLSLHSPGSCGQTRHYQTSL